QQFRVEGGIDAVGRGEESTADDEDDAGAVGVLLWTEDVHRERDAVLSTVDDVLFASVIRLGRVSGRNRHESREHEKQNTNPTHERLLLEETRAAHGT